jgi:hypothetical protein
VKLKGSWVLIRTRGGPGGSDGRGWLLIKHRDDWAGAVDVIKAAPLSVKSFGDFEDILAKDKPDVWESHRPAKGGEAGAMLAKIIERVERQARLTKKPSARSSPKRKTSAARRKR